jgi:hypothetical protein
MTLVLSESVRTLRGPRFRGEDGNGAGMTVTRYLRAASMSDRIAE